MSMRQVNELSRLYREAVYGGAKKKEEPKDTRLVVTAADKKANTPAYKNFKAGHKGYKAADHLKDDKDWGYDDKGNSLNPVDIEKKKKKDKDVKESAASIKPQGVKTPNSGSGPSIGYNQGGLVSKFNQLKGQGEKIQKRTKAWMDSKGQEGAPGLDAMKARTAEHEAKRGVKTKESTEYSDWRKDLGEANLIEVIDSNDSNEEDENYGAKKKIDVKKGIKNKVTINPNLPESIESIGGEVISEDVYEYDEIDNDLLQFIESSLGNLEEEQILDLAESGWHRRNPGKKHPLESGSSKVTPRPVSDQEKKSTDKSDRMYVAMRRVKDRQKGYSKAKSDAADRLHGEYTERQSRRKKGATPKEAAAQSHGQFGGKGFNIKRGGRGQKGWHGPRTDRGTGNKAARRAGKEVKDTRK
tara:strand:+ start:376 stop:1614 length:1239 start_codon:yes stop_codon:yes gene_type:complete